MHIEGGSMDGAGNPENGYIIRGGREMEAHFETLWDLFRSIPTLENPEISVLDEFYWLNKEDPNYSLCRATINRGQDAKTNGQFNLSQKGCMEIMKLFMTKDEDLYDKTIEDVFDEEVFDSTFWLYWRTMFAFENWHSLLELKLYMHRFLHAIDGLNDLSMLVFPKYNQYDTFIKPLRNYLEERGVKFQFNTLVKDLDIRITKDGKIVEKIITEQNDNEVKIDVRENDYVIVTTGSMTEDTFYGNNKTAPIIKIDNETSGQSAGWKLWKNLSVKFKKLYIYFNICY